jgi:hypothetical protein
MSGAAHSPAGPGPAALEAARVPLQDGDPGRVGSYWLIARLSRVELRMSGLGV